MRTCSVIDAPSDLGLRPTGIRELPNALRSAGLLEGLPTARNAEKIPVPEYIPTRDGSTGILSIGGSARFSLRLAERVAFTLDLGRFPLVLGGDCSILLGPALALGRRGRFGLFFIDGHADFYSPESGPAGEAASMELALVTGHGPDALTNIEGRRSLVREDDVVVFGFRDADRAAAAGSPDVTQTAMHLSNLAEVRRSGPVAAAEMGISVLEESGLEGIWVHLDADVLHDDVMPAVDYRIPDGLRPKELVEVLRVILASPLRVGMPITIYNPTFDDPERSAGRMLARTVTLAFAQVA